MTAAATNQSRLVQSTLLGEVTSPELRESPYQVAAGGQAFVPVGCGGVRYNVRVGMSAFGWCGDQVQPGASLAHPLPGPNRALNSYSCIGNKVRVRSGAATGATGMVSGKHELFNTFQQVLIDLPETAIEVLAPGDQVVVDAVGRGLQLESMPQIVMHSLGPRLWEAWAPRQTGGGLEVRVAQVLPARLVGIGSGRVSAATSITIQTPDSIMAEIPSINKLRLGDLVAIPDWDGAFNTGYREGSLIVGVVVHGASRRPGYGVGVTILMSARAGLLETVVDPAANLAQLLGMGTGATG
ncbi:MAG: DUF4438 domain-containing protein [Acidimicrobiales bacterium]